FFLSSFPTRRSSDLFSCGTGGIVDLSSLDLRNVDLELYDFTDKHMANAILNPFKLDDTDFTNANMFQVNFVSSKQNTTISWDYLDRKSTRLNSSHVS